MLRRLSCVLLFLAPLAPVLGAQAQSAPAAPAASAAALSEASPEPQLRLEDVVRRVLAANPSIERASILVDAQRAHVAQTGVLPDPSVTVSWMGDPVPFKVMDGDPSIAASR